MQIRVAGIELDSREVAALGLVVRLAPHQQDRQVAVRTCVGGLQRNRLRSGLVVAEVAMSLLLLIGAGLMLNSFARLVSLNRGFQPDHLLVAKLDFSISGYTSWVQPTTTRPQVTLLALIERLQAQPGVQSVAAASSLSRAPEPPRQGIVIEHGQTNETPREQRW